MKIEFYDKSGERIVTVWADVEDHWQACEYGHTIIHEQIISGADDFQVLED